MDFETEREAVGTVGAASAGSFELRMAVRKVLLNNRMTQDRMARDAGLSGSALSQWLHGKYQGDVAALEGRMAAWLADTQASALDPCEVAPVWVQTPTATAIERVCNYARTEPSIGLVYGASGVGKTKALKRYAADFDGVWYVRLKPTTSSLVEVLRAVYEAIHGGKSHETRAAEISREIAMILQWRHARGAMVIIDESQDLPLDALEELRGLHDVLGMGLVLAGNEILHSTITGGTRRAEFAQLFSRVGRRLRLDRPMEEDVDAILQAWRVQGAKEREFCGQIASLPGALREMEKVLKASAIAAHAVGAPVDIKVLRSAWRAVGGGA